MKYNDFEEFIHRENLTGLIPAQPDTLAKILCTTKFSYLFQPQLIESAADIPRREISPDLRIELRQWREEMNSESDQKISPVAHEIQAPAFTHLSEEHSTLEFTVWTEFFGMVYRLRCFFAPEGRFDYDGKFLAGSVGFYSRYS